MASKFDDSINKPFKLELKDKRHRGCCWYRLHFIMIIQKDLLNFFHCLSRPPSLPHLSYSPLLSPKTSRFQSRSFCRIKSTFSTPGSQNTTKLTSSKFCQNCKWWWPKPYSSPCLRLPSNIWSNLEDFMMFLLSIFGVFFCELFSSQKFSYPLKIASRFLHIRASSYWKDTISSLLQWLFCWWSMNSWKWGCQSVP